MRQELETKLIEKYKYMFSEYDRSTELLKRHTENIEQINAAAKAGNKEEEERLREIGKTIGSFHPIAFGFECDDGWYDLLDELMGKLSELDKEKAIVINQIKEKFGGLRFYTGGEIRMDVFGQGSFIMDRDERWAKIYSVIDEYESKSFSVCEICGKPGKICTTGYWVKTLCKDHRKVSPDSPHSKDYVPCFGFSKPGKWHPDGEQVIVKGEYLANVKDSYFDEAADQWVAVLDNGSGLYQNELKHIPHNRLYEGWYVTTPKAAGEWIISEKEFDLKEGWLYDLRNNDATICMQKESELTPVRNEKGHIKSEEDKTNADETKPAS